MCNKFKRPADAIKLQDFRSKEGTDGHCEGSGRSKKCSPSKRRNGERALDSQTPTLQTPFDSKASPLRSSSPSPVPLPSAS